MWYYTNNELIKTKINITLCIGLPNDNMENIVELNTYDKEKNIECES